MSETSHMSEVSQMSETSQLCKTNQMGETSQVSGIGQMGQKLPKFMSGRILDRRIYSKENGTIDLKNVKLIRIKDPIPGNWKVCIRNTRLGF